MSKQKYDINQPILVVIRRGRGGRGYAVAPVDSPTDVAACADTNQVGDAIVEMLDDEYQPRVDIDELMRAADGDDDERAEEEEGEGGSRGVEPSDADDEEDEDEEDEDEDEERVKLDPVDEMLLGFFGKVIDKGRKISKGSRRRRARSRKSKR